MLLRKKWGIYTDGKIVQNINNFSPVSENPKITTSSYKSKIFVN